MVDLLARPTRAAADQGPGTGRPLLAAGLLAGVASALVGVIVVAAVVMLGWGTDPHSTASTASAMRTAAGFWLFSHHGVAALGGARLALTPLGLLALPAGLLAHSGRTLARAGAVHDRITAAEAIVVTAASYVTVTVAIAGAARGGAMQVGPVSAGVSAAVVAVLAVGGGLVYEYGVAELLGRPVPAAVAATARAAAGALATLVAAGALLLAISLGWHAHRAVALVGGFSLGALGGPILLLLGLAYLPNAVVFGTAYAVGPGFAVGTGTGVSALTVHLGAVPAFPLLAALPQGVSPSPAGWAFLAAPLVAGAVAGRIVRARYVAPWWRRLGVAAAAGVAAGAGLTTLSALAGGPAGPGRLATIGPSAWQVGLMGAGEVGVVAAGVVLIAHWSPAERAGRLARQVVVRAVTAPAGWMSERARLPAGDAVAVPSEADAGPDPGNPADPADPGNPADPADADAPADPGNPADPDDPEDPADADAPADPG